VAEPTQFTGQYLTDFTADAKGERRVRAKIALRNYELPASAPIQSRAGFRDAGAFWPNARPATAW
jgi:hypothetical protein